MGHSYNQARRQCLWQAWFQELLWTQVKKSIPSLLLLPLCYTHSRHCRYMACINAICARYALLAIIFLKGRVSDWHFFVSDQVLEQKHYSQRAEHQIYQSKFRDVYFETGSGLPVGDISSSCDRDTKSSIQRREGCHLKWGLLKYGNFCNKMITSLLLQMVALLCFFVLQVISAHRVFSNFEAPFLASKEGEEQREWHDFFLCNFFSGDSDIILSYKDCLFDTKFMNEHISED